MNNLISFWVVFLASSWLTVIVLGVRPVPNQHQSNAYGQGEATTGKRWAILVAGSSGYYNYRHQADVCHAYQILKKGGLKDKNIVVFMYDDIAFNSENPRPGVIINNPSGSDVYKGVPKDYIGHQVNAHNFYAVIRGNRSDIKGGSGKVVDSGPNDFIFIYYSDHGASGILGMPDGDPVWANDFVNVLKKKHAAKAYKKMVIYVEACEAGSIFEGLLPNNMKIYATTASNASENSYATYCPGSSIAAPPEYNTCLGDLYSISWLEDSDKNDMRKESLEQQYETVRRRTLDSDPETSSHVMQFGDIKLSKDLLVTYIGGDPINVNHSYHNLNSIANAYSYAPLTSPTTLVNQRDARLLYLQLKLRKAADGSNEKLEAQKELDVEIAQRKHADNSVHLIGNLLFGRKKSSTMIANVRPAGHPLVDDWDCFKTIVKTYESHCGTLSSYGRKYLRAFANMCNAGISEQQLVVASSKACPKEKHAS